ncbi:TlpA disulfide reductase family protein [Candidatus Thioglobus sp.]|jgi:thiol-disulfide isomerase/thioredoxin|uniref:TlpA family protein disulfide reductase n=1 Tax=Candidatus Thioglobus sp. TaxID=2026721 RepID=UPI001DEB1FB1|nr:TlpA disulfide reductase family protein [Candidatus Thioglobus sp.]MBT3277185.1 TlpA family protein disulfide reductase [Candidatus Thioglobus sp.]MBT3447427.1 TlpA family protein disulfide reductase [Candidatus Thioglobus sp.]MBT3745040.1 TlpA family protein disulfide reductase [Candidatus Thioglobus sp.]MBT4000696.1 TlpA family protein disulfide reductase [Candidatus Thioglobus sp.]MBT4182171.1 TlpA family protein disulfide reductase [Candidatus Thioglobus sp.]
MKKILIILSLLLSFNHAHGITVDEIVNSAKSAWQHDKQITTPNFSLIDTQGNTHTNASTQGKYLVINFWATWCPPCLKEIPAFVEFYENNKDQVLIIGLDYEQADPKSIAEFTDTFMVNYPIVLFDAHNGPQFAGFGEVIGMPTTYIYNPEGKLVDFKMGEMDIESLQQAILK